MISESLARRAVQAARTFQRREYWLRIGNEDALAFELPDEPLPTYAAILGAAGQHFGISLYRGEHALEQLRQVIIDPRPAFVATMLVLSFDPPGAVPPELRTIAALAGVSDRIIPVFFAVDAGLKKRDIRTAEVRCLNLVLDAIEIADARHLLQPRRFQPHRACKVLTLKVTGGGREIDVAARYAEVPGPAQPFTPAVDLPWPMPELPIVDAHWLIGVEPSPIRIAGSEEHTFVLIAADADDGAVVGIQAMLGDDTDEMARQLAEVCSKKGPDGGGIPARLTFAHQRLHDSLAEALLAIGVQVAVVAEHEFLTEIAEGLASAAEPDDPERVPGPDDSAGWGKASMHLFQRLLKHPEARSVGDHKPQTVFFGGEEAATIVTAENLQVAKTSYLEWYVVCYRGKAGRRTLAERTFDAPMPLPQRLMLEARMKARAGIYRIVRVHAPAVTVADVLSDYQTDLIDGSLAASVQAGELVPGRIGEAGGHRFLVPFGPKLRPTMIDAALAWLERDGQVLSAATLQSDPGRLGQLWAYVVQFAGQDIQLTNSDGDVIASQSATFRVADAAALHAALRERSDVEADAPDHWTWIRRRGNDNTVLGSFEMFGDELLLHVNSDERLAGAKAWLLAIPGVTFVRTAQLQKRGAGADSGGIDPASLPPEALQQVHAHLHQRYMAWLDEPIPALGNRTPREAVKTPAGKQQVLRLIRTMPDPSGIPGLEVPRAQMRTSLGCEAEEGA